MRKRIYCSTALLFGLSLMTIFMVGCGGGGTSTALTPGVTAVGTLVTTVGSRTVKSSAITRGASGYPEVFIAPSIYRTALAKLELLKSADDPNPYVVFDTSTVDDPSGVNNPKIIDLLGNGSTATFGSNSSYPAAGTYTHARFTLSYLEMTIPATIDETSGWVDHNFRIYASTVGNVQDGDVLVEVNSVWSWIFDGGYYDVAGDRPDAADRHPAQQNGFKDDTLESPDPYTMTMALSAPVVIPVAPNGQYVVAVNFDVTKSPEVPGSTGTFIFEDVNSDGKFEPGLPVAQGGDDVRETTQAPGEWNSLPPTITVTCVKQ